MISQSLLKNCFNLSQKLYKTAIRSVRSSNDKALSSWMKSSKDSFELGFKVPKPFEAEDVAISVIGTNIIVEANKRNETSETIQTHSIFRKYVFTQNPDLGRIGCVFHNGMVTINGPFVKDNTNSNGNQEIVQIKK